VNLAETWGKAGVNEKQELQLAVFPEGLMWSPEVAFFEPGNTSLMQAVQELWKDLEKESGSVQDGCGGLQPSVRTLHSLLFHNPTESSDTRTSGPKWSLS